MRRISGKLEDTRRKRRGVATEFHNLISFAGHYDGVERFTCHARDTHGLHARHTSDGDLLRKFSFLVLCNHTTLLYIFQTQTLL
jgi:hypothetical protein